MSALDDLIAERDALEAERDVLEAALRDSHEIVEAVRQAIDQRPDPRAKVHIDLEPLFERLVIAASDRARAALAGVTAP